MNVNPIPTNGLIKFRIRVNGKDVVVELDPSKWDSINNAIRDLKNYARGEGNHENHRYLLHLADLIETIGVDLFTLENHHESDQDWTKVLESLLQALAEAVKLRFHPITVQVDQPAPIDYR